MKSFKDPSLPLSVYGPARLTHKASQGVLITMLDGRCPYFCVRFTFTWQDLHDFVMDWTVFLIPFQFIADFIVSMYAQGAVDSGDTTSLHAVAMASELRAYLYCIYNFCFQQVEVSVLYLEQLCV